MACWEATLHWLNACSSEQRGARSPQIWSGSLILAIAARCALSFANVSAAESNSPVDEAFVCRAWGNVGEEIGRAHV